MLRGFLVTPDSSPTSLSFYDGSGLSREDLVTPEATVHALQLLPQTELGASYSKIPCRSPVTDGSLADRFKQHPVRRDGSRKNRLADPCHIPSPAMRPRSRGDHMAFSIMTNNHNMPTKKALDTIDEIVVRLRLIKK